MLHAEQPRGARHAPARLLQRLPDQPAFQFVHRPEQAEALAEPSPVSRRMTKRAQALSRAASSAFCEFFKSLSVRMYAP